MTQRRRLTFKKQLYHKKNTALYQIVDRWKIQKKIAWEQAADEEWRQEILSTT